MRSFQQPERVVGKLPSNPGLKKKHSRKKKQQPKTKARVQTDRAWDQTEGRKKKRSYELYLLCPRSFAAFTSVCGYLFTEGQIAGSARSRWLLASHWSCCSCHGSPASHSPLGPSPSNPGSCILRDPLPALLCPSSLRDLLPARPHTHPGWRAWHSQRLQWCPWCFPHFQVVVPSFSRWFLSIASCHHQQHLSRAG